MKVGCVTVSVTVLPCESTDVIVRMGGGVGVVLGGGIAEKIVGGAVGVPDVGAVEDASGVIRLDISGELPPWPRLAVVIYGDPLLVMTGPPVSPLEKEPLEAGGSVLERPAETVTVETMVVVIYVLVIYVVGAF